MTPSPTGASSAVARSTAPSGLLNRELRQLIADVEQGRMTTTGTTFGGLLDKWLDMAADNLSPTTMREYRRLVTKRIGPALGSTPLIKLTTPQLDDFYLALTREAGLSPGSVRQIHSIVRRGLKQGVKSGWLQLIMLRCGDCPPPRHGPHLSLGVFRSRPEVALPGSRLLAVIGLADKLPTASFAVSR